MMNDNDIQHSSVMNYLSTFRHGFCCCLIFGLLFVLVACGGQERRADNAAFATGGSGAASDDMGRILSSGELIIVTVSGPDTYYEYQGRAMGLQYALAEDFARGEGLRLRVETVRDTADMFRMVREGKADVAACLLPTAQVEGEGCVVAGVRDDSLGRAWAIAAGHPALAQALDGWYATGVRVEVTRDEARRHQERRQVRRKVRAPYISKEQGIISTYDNHFRLASRATGWDWRLIAAQCYQESGFDPHAQSWAGACGLMQIMPSTAAHLGLSRDRIFDPVDNIAAAARYIRELRGMFAGVCDREEQIKFVLASYNAGPGHVQDAMALARKYGRNPHRWADVGYYVLHLSEAKYYRDPVVKHGYMIGEETYGYVSSVWERWRAYGGSVGRLGMPASDVRSVDDGQGTNSERQPRRSNKYTRGTKVYRPDDPEFFNM